MRNRRNEARLLLVAFADSDHGPRLYAHRAGGSNQRRRSADSEYARRNIKTL